MSKQYLILGTGIAGLSAARTIRLEDPEGMITLIGAETDSPYLRPLLSKTDFRRLQRQKILAAPEEWYEENRITLLKGLAVESLDPDRRQVLLSDGRNLPYDKCIYALGADCFVPPIPGREKAGVLTLRSIGDFHHLRKRCMTAKTAVLIGGGVIGIEMAWELTQLGIRCTILEAMPRLMARQLDEESAARLKERIEAAGCGCFTGVQISGITGQDQADGVDLADGQDQADVVDLADGRHFPADIVILSTGVRPVTGPARRAGLVCDRGVVTSPQLFTSDPDILAAGDCIQCGGPNPGLWNYARISGEIAGYNAVHPDDPKTFEAGTFPLIMSAMNMGLFAAGITAESEEVTAEVRCWENAEQPDQFRVNEKALGSAQRGSRGSVQGTALGTAPGTAPGGFLRAETYEKRFYRDNRLCGAVLIGDISGMAEILDELEAIRGKYKAEEYNP